VQPGTFGAAIRERPASVRVQSIMDCCWFPTIAGSLTHGVVPTCTRQ
jgi:hypothetical protein